MFLDREHGLVAVARDLYLETGLLQVVGDQLDERGFVFDDQDAGLQGAHGLSLRGA